MRFLDGHDAKHSLAALGDLVTERGNPGNRRRIAGVTVYVAAPVLEGGVELVDTPGTGSVFECDTQTAHEAGLMGLAGKQGRGGNTGAREHWGAGTLGRGNTGARERWGAGTLGCGAQTELTFPD